MNRFRITYAKKGALRYTGMLDLQKMWERVFRRAKLPVAYSQGFHPLPKFHMAAPLPLGFNGEQELADIWLTEEVELVAMQNEINQTSPDGLNILSIEPIDLSAPVLQTIIDSVDYEISPMVEIDEIHILSAIENLLNQSHIERVRRNKPYDLRPLIKGLKYEKSSRKITMQLLAREGASGRPEEVISSLGFDPLSFSYSRTKIHLLE